VVRYSFPVRLFHPRLQAGLAWRFLGAVRVADRGRESLCSPSLRTGQADFPHPALQLVVLPPRGLTRQRASVLQRKQPVLGEEGLRPAHQAVPLASQYSLFEGGQHPFRPDLGFDPGPASPNLSGGSSPFSGHYVRGLLRFVRHVSTFLRSLRSRPVTALLRYYGRSVSCPRRRGSARVSSRRPPDRLCREQVSLIHSPDLPALPSPTTCESPGRPRTPERRGPDSHPHLPGCGASLTMSRLAVLAGRIEFVILRTGRSPPAAPHPALRRRSCRLITAWRWIHTGEDFHLSDQVRSQAHSFPRKRESSSPTPRFKGLGSGFPLSRE